jgi:hypothetical protein
MKHAGILLVLVSGWINGQPPITAPQIGFAQDAKSGLRRVSGVAGSFQLSDPIRTGVASSAFSGSLGMAKTETALSVFDAAGQILFQIPVKPGAALFAFADDGESALAYLAHEQALLWWSRGALTSVALDSRAADGELRSIAQPSATQASILLDRGGSLWALSVSLASGAIEFQRTVRATGSAALLLNNGDLLFDDPEGVTLDRANGIRIHFDAKLSGHIALRQMGAGWVEISDAGGRHFALKLQPGRERLYQLPEARP